MYDSQIQARNTRTVFKRLLLAYPNNLLLYVSLVSREERLVQSCITAKNSAVYPGVVVCANKEIDTV